MKTTVSLSHSEFASLNGIPNLHIVISVKDFRTIIAHAATLKASITAMYSRPNQPLKFQYQSGGMKCQFTLMTGGSYEGLLPISEATAVVHNNPTFSSTRRTGPAMTPAGLIDYQAHQRDNPQNEPDLGFPPVPSLQARSHTPRPLEPSTAPRSQVRKLGQARNVPVQETLDREPVRSIPKDRRVQRESLFVSEDEDGEWDPPDYEGEEWLGWDASSDLVSICLITEKRALQFPVMVLTMISAEQ